MAAPERAWRRYAQLCTEEAVRGLWFNRRTVLPALVVMTTSLIVLGAFLLVSENLGAVLARWRERGQMQLFLDDAITEQQQDAIAAVLGESEEVALHRLITSAEAAELFRTDFRELGDVLAMLDENPLPSSFSVSIASQMRSERLLQQLAEEWGALPGVDGVQYDLQIIRRLELGVRAVRFVALLLGGTVLLAAVITTANVVRVLVVARAREIDVMRLVGAPDAVVVGRFLFEGALQGLVSGVLAVGLLYAAFSMGLSYVGGDAFGLLASVPLRFLRATLVAGLIGGGLATGLLGSCLAFGPGGGLRSEI